MNPEPFNRFHILKRPLRMNGFVVEKRDSGLLLVRGKVCAIIMRDGVVQEVHETTNIVTNAGDRFYAYRGADEQPTDAHFTTGAAKTFDGVMIIANGASTAPAKGNDFDDIVGEQTPFKAMEATYPKSDDTGNSENTGAAVDAITYKAIWAAGEATANNYDDVCLTNPTPGAAENLLMHAEFSATFNKAAADTLVVYINHTMNGT